MRGATPLDETTVEAVAISIHAPCEGSDVFYIIHDFINCISIHAPCEGSDFSKGTTSSDTSISIHAPCEGSDCFVVVIVTLLLKFQSTLPVRGATEKTIDGVTYPDDFNPRSL